MLLKKKKQEQDQEQEELHYRKITSEHIYWTFIKENFTVDYKQYFLHCQQIIHSAA